MSNSNQLENKVYLVVEDEYLTATLLTMGLEEEGARVVGPVSYVEGALELLTGYRPKFNGFRTGRSSGAK